MDNDSTQNSEAGFGPTWAVISMMIMLMVSLLLSMGPWAAAIKALGYVAMPPAPVRVPSQRPLTRGLCHIII